MGRGKGGLIPVSGAGIPTKVYDFGRTTSKFKVAMGLPAISLDEM